MLLHEYLHSCDKCWTQLYAFLSIFAVFQGTNVWWEGWSGTQCCRGQFHQSISKPRVCPHDRPQPPPTGTTCRMNPNYNMTYIIFPQHLMSLFELSSCPVIWDSFILTWYVLAGEALEFAMASVNLGHPQLNWPVTSKTCRRERMSSTHTGRRWAAARTVRGTLHCIS